MYYQDLFVDNAMEREREKKIEGEKERKDVGWLGFSQWLDEQSVRRQGEREGGSRQIQCNGNEEKISSFSFFLSSHSQVYCFSFSLQHLHSTILLIIINSVRDYFCDATGFSFLSLHLIQLHINFCLLFPTLSLFSIHTVMILLVVTFVTFFTST